MFATEAMLLLMGISILPHPPTPATRLLTPKEETISLPSLPLFAGSLQVLELILRCIIILLTFKAQGQGPNYISDLGLLLSVQIPHQLNNW